VRFGDFSEIWCLDFEFRQEGINPPEVRCWAAKEVFTGKEVSGWVAAAPLPAPDFLSRGGCLVVAHYALAELHCLAELKWPMPARLVDSWVEFKCITNGRGAPMGLYDAAAFYDLKTPHTQEFKETMRSLALRPGAYSAEERQHLVDYCLSDVRITRDLVLAMEVDIDLARAVAVRGEYLKAVCVVEKTGIPVDARGIARVLQEAPAVVAALADDVRRELPILTQSGGIDMGRLEDWIGKQGVLWPRTATGQPSLGIDELKELGLRHQGVNALREFLKTRRQLIDGRGGLEVQDGRSWFEVRPFATKTSRNQPRARPFLFSQPRWMRNLIVAPEDAELVYLDYSQQEFAIAAVASGDGAMLQAYESGDPYLAFAKLAGAVPADGTKESHGRERDLYKTCLLGQQYGLREEGLARRLGIPPCYAADLISQHHRVFPGFWSWTESVADAARLGCPLQSALGWRLNPVPGPDFNVRSAQNFPVQATGADILRVAMIALHREGVRVCAPVHDAVLIEVPAGCAEDAIRTAQQILAQASSSVLGGFTLRCDAKRTPPGARYVAEGGEEMWKIVSDAIGADG
jgi:hypothetical protein